ncbi:MAG: hypothetical protein QM632_00655 [Micrococcaceae bacterium]
MAPPFDGVPKIPASGGSGTATQYNIKGIDSDGTSYALTPDQLVPATTQSAQMVFLKNFATTPEKLKDPDVNSWVYNSLKKTHPNIQQVSITKVTVKSSGGKTEQIGSGKPTVIDFSGSKS